MRPNTRRSDLQDAAAQPPEPDPSALAHRIVDVASDHKATDIVMLRLTELTTLADFFIICSGRSERQVAGVAGGIIDELRADGVRPLGVEGRANARWVLVDYGSVVVHIFTPDERDYYGLERLWHEATPVVRLV